MTPYQKRVTAFTKRMAEDMQLRNLSPRTIGERDGRVYFMARSKRKDEGQVEASLSKVEFVQQWCLHILPKDFTKTRFFGSGTSCLVRMDEPWQMFPAG